MNVIDEHNPSMSTTYINNRVSNSPIDIQDFNHMSPEQQQMMAAQMSVGVGMGSSMLSYLSNRNSGMSP
jgi:hypothetical protein